MKIPNKQELQQVAFNHSSHIDHMNLYKKQIYRWRNITSWSKKTEQARQVYIFSSGWSIWITKKAFEDQEEKEKTLEDQGEKQLKAFENRVENVFLDTDQKSMASSFSKDFQMKKQHTN